MAKGKHSAALFEVIVPTKPLDRQRRAGLFRSVAGWLRAARARREARPAPAVSIPAFEPPASFDLPDREPLALSYEPPADARPRGGRRELHLRVTYTTAAITACVLISTMALAFMAGRNVVLGPRPLIATTTTESLRRTAPNPSVTQLPRTTVQLAHPGDRAIPGGGNPPRIFPPVQQPPITQPPATRSRTRTVNLNYVVIQSYPVQEKQMAEEARDLLIRNGIDCDVIKDLAGWKGWYTVVGTEGFERISRSPALDAYMRKVRQISAAAHAKMKKNSFKAFDPTTIKWKTGN